MYAVLRQGTWSKDPLDIYWNLKVQATHKERKPYVKGPQTSRTVFVLQYVLTCVFWDSYGTVAWRGHRGGRDGVDGGRGRAGFGVETLLFKAKLQGKG